MALFSRRDREELAGLRAEVQGLQGRLSSDIASLDPGEDPVCRQALNDAAERSNAAGALLAHASGSGEMRVVLRIIVEGLTSTRVIRARQGLPLGADLPDVSSVVPVAVPGRPGLAPAAPMGQGHTPFWQKALAVGGAVVGVEMLGDMLGGGERYDNDETGFSGGWGDGGDD